MRSKKKNVPLLGAANHSANEDARELKRISDAAAEEAMLFARRLADFMKKDQVHRVLSDAIEHCLRVDPLIEGRPYCLGFLLYGLQEFSAQRGSSPFGIPKGILVRQWCVVLTAVLTSEGLDRNPHHPFLVDFFNEQLLGVGSHGLVLLPSELEYTSTVRLVMSLQQKAARNAHLRSSLSNLERFLTTKYGSISEPHHINGSVRTRLAHLQATLFPELRLHFLQRIWTEGPDSVIERIHTMLHTTRTRKRSRKSSEVEFTIEDVEVCCAALQKKMLDPVKTLTLTLFFLSFKVAANIQKKFLEDHVLQILRTQPTAVLGLNSTLARSIFYVLLVHLGENPVANHLCSVTYTCARELMLLHEDGNGYLVDIIKATSLNRARTTDVPDNGFPVGFYKQSQYENIVLHRGYFTFLAHLIDDALFTQDGYETAVDRCLSVMDRVTWRSLVQHVVQYGYTGALNAMRDFIGKKGTGGIPVDVLVVLFPSDEQIREEWLDRLMLYALESVREAPNEQSSPTLESSLSDETERKGHAFALMMGSEELTEAFFSFFISSSPGVSHLLILLVMETVPIIPSNRSTQFSRAFLSTAALPLLEKCFRSDPSASGYLVESKEWQSYLTDLIYVCVQLLPMTYRNFTKRLSREDWPSAYPLLVQFCDIIRSIDSAPWVRVHTSANGNGNEFVLQLRVYLWRHLTRLLGTDETRLPAQVRIIYTSIRHVLHPVLKLRRLLGYTFCYVVRKCPSHISVAAEELLSTSIIPKSREQCLLLCAEHGLSPESSFRFFHYVYENFLAHPRPSLPGVESRSERGVNIENEFPRFLIWLTSISHTNNVWFHHVCLAILQHPHAVPALLRQVRGEFRSVQSSMASMHQHKNATWQRLQGLTYVVCRIVLWVLHYSDDDVQEDTEATRTLIHTFLEELRPFGEQLTTVVHLDPNEEGMETQLQVTTFLSHFFRSKGQTRTSQPGAQMSDPVDERTECNTFAASIPRYEQVLEDSASPVRVDLISRSMEVLDAASVQRQDRGNSRGISEREEPLISPENREFHATPSWSSASTAPDMSRKGEKSSTTPPSSGSFATANIDGSRNIHSLDTRKSSENQVSVSAHARRSEASKEQRTTLCSAEASAERVSDEARTTKDMHTTSSPHSAQEPSNNTMSVSPRPSATVLVYSECEKTGDCTTVKMLPPPSSAYSTRLPTHETVPRASQAPSGSYVERPDALSFSGLSPAVVSADEAILSDVMRPSNESRAASALLDMPKAFSSLRTVFQAACKYHNATSVLKELKVVQHSSFDQDSSALSSLKIQQYPHRCVPKLQGHLPSGAAQPQHKEATGQVGGDVMQHQLKKRAIEMVGTQIAERKVIDTSNPFTADIDKVASFVRLLRTSANRITLNWNPVSTLKDLQAASHQTEALEQCGANVGGVPRATPVNPSYFSFQTPVLTNCTVRGPCVAQQLPREYGTESSSSLKKSQVSNINRRLDQNGTRDRDKDAQSTLNQFKKALKLQPMSSALRELEFKVRTEDCLAGKKNISG